MSASHAEQLVPGGAWPLLVLLALAVFPVLIIRAVVGVRPVAAAPDVASLELAAGIRQPTPAYLFSR